MQDVSEIVFRYVHIFPDMPCIKRIYKTKDVDILVRGQRRAAIVPWINRGSNGPNRFAGSVFGFCNRQGYLHMMYENILRIQFLYSYMRTCMYVYVIYIGQEFVPGHALHEKSLQRQTGVGTLGTNLE